jgi:V8-like Glu-specific endopeptidase
MFQVLRTAASRWRSPWVQRNARHGPAGVLRCHFSQFTDGGLDASGSCIGFALSLLVSAQAFFFAQSASSADTGGGRYFAVTPYRMVDSRSTTAGALLAYEERWLQVTNTNPGQVPSGATAVVIDVASTQSAAAGHFILYQYGLARPGTSNLNLIPGQTVSNTAIVPLSSSGRMNIYNSSSGSSHFVIDVQGYFAASSSSGGTYHPVEPTRVLDTRTTLGNHNYRVPPGEDFQLSLAAGGIPASGVAAVAVNVTVTAATGPGNLLLYQDGSTRPNTTTIEFHTNLTVATAATVRVSSSTKVRVHNNSSSEVHVLVDVVGWLSPTTTVGEGGHYTPVTPVRVADTRWALGLASSIPAYDTLDLDVVGVGGVPTTNVAAVVLNLTAITPAATGHVIAWSADTEQPRVSNLNFTSPHTRANLAIVEPSADGLVSIYNHSSQPLHMVIDVQGWFHTRLSEDPACGFDLACDRSLAVAASAAVQANMRTAPSLPEGDDALIVEDGLPSSQELLDVPDVGIPESGPVESTKPYPSDYSNRTQITTTPRYPFSATGYLRFKFSDGSGSGCTAWLFSDRDVGTSGHCVFNQREKKGWISSADFYPGQFVNSAGQLIRPYGVCTMKPGSQWSVKGWVEDARASWDYGGLEIDHCSKWSVSAGQTSAYVGYLGYTSQYNKNYSGVNITLAGYAPALCGGRDRYCYGSGSMYGETDQQVKFRVKCSSGDSGASIKKANHRTVGIYSGRRERGGVDECVAKKMTGRAANNYSWARRT